MVPTVKVAEKKSPTTVAFMLPLPLNSLPKNTPMKTKNNESMKTEGTLLGRRIGTPHLVTAKRSHRIGDSGDGAWQARNGR
jgi:hypothetical protein